LRGVYRIIGDFGGFDEGDIAQDFDEGRPKKVVPVGNLEAQLLDLNRKCVEASYSEENTRSQHGLHSRG
jgi:hypothetical protein